MSLNVFAGFSLLDSHTCRGCAWQRRIRTFGAHLAKWSFDFEFSPAKKSREEKDDNANKKGRHNDYCQCFIHNNSVLVSSFPQRLPDICAFSEKIASFFAPHPWRMANRRQFFPLRHQNLDYFVALLFKMGGVPRPLVSRLQKICKNLPFL